MEICGFFAAASGMEMLRSWIFAGQHPREGIKGAQREAGKCSGHFL